MASKRRLRRITPRCESKNRHTREQARKAAASLRHRTGGTMIHHYYCEQHECWHVGHQPARNRKAMAKRRAGTR